VLTPGATGAEESVPIRPAAGHVLIVRTDNVGDVLMSGPATRAVAASARRVTYLASPQGEAAARLLPGVDAVETASIPWIDACPATADWDFVLGTVGRLRSLAVDEAVILTSFHQSPLPMALLLRAGGVGAIVANSVDFPGSLLDVRVQADDDLHEVRRGLAICAAGGFTLGEGDDGRLEVVLGDGAGVPPEVPPQPYVVVHPGASVRARAWAPDRLADAIGALVAAGRRVVVTGGPGERALTRAVAGDRHDVVDLGGRTDLASLAAVLAGADAVVVGNTGPAHLAAAVGTPVVSLYAPTVPACRWHPWMVPHRLLGDQGVVCAGCRARDCPVPGHPCLGRVTSRDVVAAVDELAGAALVAEVLR
jgi:ADP-heptose:LPS heptosyltransferase